MNRQEDTGIIKKNNETAFISQVKDTKNRYSFGILLK